jgi:hypothetical protein
MNLLTHIIRLLLTIVPSERGRYLQEEIADYLIEPSQSLPDPKPGSNNLHDLLQDIPLV